MRGRGRGGRGGRGASHDARREALEEFHLDAAETDQAPPPLYPPINVDALRPPGLAPSEDEQYLLDKMGDLEARYLASPFYLSSRVQRTDVQRYSDTRLRGAGLAHLTLFDCIAKTGDDINSYIPLELRKNESDRTVSGSRDGKFMRQTEEGGMKRRRVDVMKLLEGEERKGEAGEGKRAEGEEEEEEEEAEERVDEEDDYGVDHYASDNEGYASGGGDEPFYD